MVINLEHTKKIIIAMAIITLYLLIKYSPIVYLPSYTYVTSNPTIPSDTTGCTRIGGKWINSDGDVWEDGEFRKK